MLDVRYQKLYDRCHQTVTLIDCVIDHGVGVAIKKYTSQMTEHNLLLCSAITLDSTGVIALGVRDVVCFSLYITE